MAAGLLAFFIALTASMLLVFPVRALALRVGMVDLPGPRKVHLTPIPLLGGLAMYFAMMIAVIFAFDGPARAQIEGILAGATLVAAIGILDDRGCVASSGEVIHRHAHRGHDPAFFRNSRAGF